MRRIGIYGGPFNPIHTGHISLAQHILSAARLDGVWLVVSPQNPLKAGNGSLIDDEVRLRLARKALEGVSGISVSDCEFHMPRPSYMWHTLRHLSETNPDVSFTLIIGADNWLDFDRWYRSRDIIAAYNVIIFPREGYPVDATKLPQGVCLVNTPLFPISSTEIRQKVARGESITGLVPAAIEDDVMHIYGHVGTDDAIES